MDRARLWNPRFVQLFCIEALLQFGLYLTRPLIAGYAVSLGASLVVAGFLAGLLATAALVARPVSGIAADKLGKKGLLCVACALFAASAVGCAVCASVPLVALFLALQGFAFAFKSTLVVSLAALVVPEAKLGSGVGWLGVAYTIACALGPACGSLVGEVAGYVGAFAVSGALLLAGLVLALLFREPQVRGDAANGYEEDMRNSEACDRRCCEDARETICAARGAGTLKAFGVSRLSAWLYGPALLLSVVAGLLMVAQGVTSSFIVLVGDMRGIEGASWYFLVYSLATLAARPLAGRASDALGVRTIALPMMLLAAVGMGAAAFLDSFAGVAVAGVCMGVGQGSAYCALQAESVRGVPADKVGRAANTFYLGPDLCMGLGPVVGGCVLQAAGVPALFLFNAGAILVGMALLLVLGMRRGWGNSP